MAANIFELIIGSSGAGTVNTSTNLPLPNLNFHNWSLHNFFNYNTPDDWTLVSGFGQQPIGVGVFTSLDLINEDFTQSFINIIPPATYDGAHSSFYNAYGWVFQMFTIANDGLDSSDSWLIEFQSNTGFGYYNFNVDRTIPDLTLYGRRSSSGLNPERTGKALDMKYLPSTTSTHPNTIIHSNNEPYLNSLYTAENFSKISAGRCNFGSITTVNGLITFQYVSHATTGTVGNADRCLKSKESVVVFHEYISLWGFDNSNYLHFTNANHLTDLGMFSLKGKPKYTAPKYSGLSEDSFIPLMYFSEGGTFRDTHPPLIAKLENIFSNHVIGTPVVFDLTFGSYFNLAAQFLAGTYIDGVIEGGSQPQGEYYIDMQPNAAVFTVVNGVVSGTTLGSFYPLTTTSNETYSSSGAINSNSPFINEGSSVDPLGSSLLIRHVNDGIASFKARAEVSLTEGTTYNVSFNIKEKNGTLRVRIWALNADGSEQSVIHNQVMVGSVAYGDNEIYHFTFNTNTFSTRYAIDIEVANKSSEVTFARINYIRFDETNYGITEFLLREDYDENTDSLSVRMAGTRIGDLKSSGVNSLAPIIITSSPVISYPLAYTKYKSTSPYYDTFEVSDNNAGFNPYGADVTERHNVELPFSNTNGVYVQGEEQVGIDPHTSRVVPSEFSELRDADGVYFAGGKATIRIEMIVGSNDLRLFIDNSFSDNVIIGNYDLFKVDFLDSQDSFITRDDSGGNKIRLKYDPTNGVKAPIAIQTDDIAIGSIGEPIQIDYNITSLSGGDRLMIDTGEGTNALAISSSGVGSANVEAGGLNIRIRPETLLEKGSALQGLDSVIDYVKVSAEVVGGIVKTIKYGDETSVNPTEAYVGEYDAAMSIANVDVATGAFVVGDVTASMNRAIPVWMVLGAAQVTISVTVTNLNPNNYVTVRNNLSGSYVDTIISSGSSTPVDIVITEVPSNLGAAWLTLTFDSGGSSDTLYTTVSNVTITSVITEAGATKDVSLDLLEDFKIPLTASIKDFRDLGSATSSFSKTVNLPATAKNKLAFKFENELSSMSNKYSWSGVYQHVKPIRFDLKAEGVSVFKGFANLLGSTLDELGTLELETNLVSGNADWVEVLNEVDLKSIPSNQYVITSQSVIDSSLNNYIDAEIFFPLVDNGRWLTRDSENPDAANIGWDNIKAAFGLRKLLDKIFEITGYKLISDFFNETTELSEDFSIDLASFNQRLIGIAPSMFKAEVAIVASGLDLSFDSAMLTGGGYHKQASASSADPLGKRPFVNSKFLGHMTYQGVNITPYGYYIDYAYIHFNLVNVDKSNAHSYENIGADDVLGGVLSHTNDSTKKLNGNTISTGNSKSVIQVAANGYYEVNSAVNFNLSSEGDGFVEDFGFGGVNEETSETKVTIMLVEDSFAADDLYKTDPTTGFSFGFNAFDLYDENTVVFSSVTYENTRVSLSRIQFLEAGKKYHVVMMVGTRQVFLDECVFSSSFVINELDLNLKLCKEAAPMAGRYNCVYSEVAAPRVSYAEVLPDVKAVEFISEITKMFNLLWTTNQLNREVTVEPFNDFYDFSGDEFGFKDLTETALITKISNNEITSEDVTYSMLKDSSDYALKGNTSGGSALSFGDKKVSFSQNGLSNVANPSSDEGNEVALNIFSALKMGYDRFVSRTTAGSIGYTLNAATDNLSTSKLWLPRIWTKPDSTLEPTLPEEKPSANNSHEFKLAYIKGVGVTDESLSWMSNNLIQAITTYDDSLTVVHYALEENFIWYSEWEAYAPNAGAYGFNGMFRYNEIPSVTYLEVGSYFPSDPDSPSTSFADTTSGSGGVSGLFNSYHQGLMDMLIMRDKIITAEVMLTSEDLRSINFRQLIKIDNELYILNKVKDFNFSGEPTEVELLLVTRTGTNHQIL